MSSDNLVSEDSNCSKEVNSRIATGKKIFMDMEKLNPFVRLDVVHIARV